MGGVKAPPPTPPPTMMPMLLPRSSFGVEVTHTHTLSACMPQQEIPCAQASPVDDAFDAMDTPRYDEALSPEDIVKAANDNFSAMASRGEAQQKEVELNEVDKKFKQVVDDGVFDTRQAVGHAWSKSIAADPDLKAKCSQESDRANKARFRQQRAVARYNEIEKKVKAYRETYSTIDTKTGVYLTFRKVWWKEGLGNAGYKPAVCYCSKGSGMGGAWMRHDAMADTTTFLYFELGVSEEHSRCWSLYKASATERRPPQKQEVKGKAEHADTRAVTKKPKEDAIVQELKTPTGMANRGIKRDQPTPEVLSGVRGDLIGVGVSNLRRCEPVGLRNDYGGGESQEPHSPPSTAPLCTPNPQG